jgi:uncharacterized protein (TIGR03067 family)
MTSKMRWACLFLASLMGTGRVVVAGGGRAAAVVEGDLKRMQGSWATDSFGEKPAHFTFNGSKLEVKTPDVEYRIAITIDEKARPERTIDLKTEESTIAVAVGKTSPGIYKFEGDDTLIVCFRARGDRPGTYETQGFEQWRVELKRLSGGAAGGTKAAAPGAKAVAPAAADSDAPLPEGWPRVTAPGAIEVKTYPKYRSAIVREKAATMARGEGMFFSLFGHITTRRIEMTAPVVMTYEPRIVEHVGEKGEASMEFLYQHPDQGQLGPGVGKVKVEDHPAVTVVSMGVQGEIEPERMRASVERLRAWLDEHKREWVAAGPPRRLGYHGPQTPVARRVNEVQIPIRPVGEGKSS